MTSKLKAAAVDEMRYARSEGMYRKCLLAFCAVITRMRIRVRKGIETWLYENLRQFSMNAVRGIEFHGVTQVTTSVRQRRGLERLKSKLFYASWWPRPVNIIFDVEIKAGQPLGMRTTQYRVRVDLSREYVTPVWFWEHLCQVKAMLEE